MSEDQASGGPRQFEVSDRRYADRVADAIADHLFIVPLNNSGSSYLSRVISACSRTITLRREGQHVAGWGGPVPAEADLSFIWGSSPDYPALLADPANYDWDHIKRCWYAASWAATDEADLFVEKSPPHVGRVPLLDQAFPGARYIFLVRNPYAVAESIGRMRPHARDFARVAAAHLVTVLGLQRDNAALVGERGLVLRYEDMCADPDGTTQRIVEHVPQLNDLVIDQRVAVKGRYDERLRDMNADQIGRIPPGLIQALTREFRPHAELLGSFGYELMEG